MTKTIAFLGLGVIGAPMTLNLIKQGYSVLAWNRTVDRPSVQMIQAQGGKVVGSIEKAVLQADYIFTCVSDVPDIEEVLLGERGVLHFAPKTSLIVDFSTIGSQTAIKLHNSLQEKGLRFLDAPISGGDIGAKNGTLTIMVGGAKNDFDEIHPILQAIGKNIYYCGEIGSGQAVKLCNQVLASLHMVALCEALELAKKQGIDPNLMIEVCSTGAAGSWALSHLAPKIVTEDFAPGFMIKHILKDLRLVQETLKDEVSLKGVDLAQTLFQKVQLMDNGRGGNLGTQAMIKAYSLEK